MPNQSGSFEKRRHPRHPVSSPLKYNEVSAKHTAGSVSVDISEGGLCFMAATFMPQGGIMKFTIPVADRVFHLDGKTTYSTFVPGTGFYRTGIEIQNPEFSYIEKLNEEITEIEKHRRKLSADLGYEVSQKEAASSWVESCAKHFTYSF